MRAAKGNSEFGSAVSAVSASSGGAAVAFVARNPPRLPFPPSSSPPSTKTQSNAPTNPLTKLVYSTYPHADVIESGCVRCMEHAPMGSASHPRAVAVCSAVKRDSAAASSSAAELDARASPSSCARSSRRTARATSSASGLGRPSSSPAASRASSTPRAHSGGVPFPSVVDALGNGARANPSSDVPGVILASARSVYAATTSHVLNVHPARACACATARRAMVGDATSADTSASHARAMPRCASATRLQHAVIRPSLCCLSFISLVELARSLSSSSASPASSSSSSSLASSSSSSSLASPSVVTARSAFAAARELVPPHRNTLPSAQSECDARSVPSATYLTTPSCASPLKSPQTISPTSSPAPESRPHARRSVSAWRRSHRACSTRRCVAPG
eukprot:31497-Pelagococcus_subviridis.AAC.54